MGKYKQHLMDEAEARGEVLDITDPRGDALASQAEDGHIDNDGEWHPGEEDPGADIDEAMAKLDDQQAEFNDEEGVPNGTF